MTPADRTAARDRFARLMADAESMPEREFRIQTHDDEFTAVMVATAHGYYREEEVAQTMLRL